MKVLVLDTSVVIDLERAGLLDVAFELPYEFIVPDLLYKRELRDHGGRHLQSLGLRIEELDGDGVALALQFRQQVPPLSLADAFALALAKTNGFVLLTGDKALRQLAGTEGVSCSGVLWAIAQLYDWKVCSPRVLHAALSTVANHPRCRLPRREVSRLLEKLAAAFED